MKAPTKFKKAFEYSHVTYLYSLNSFDNAFTTA